MIDNEILFSSIYMITILLALIPYLIILAIIRDKKQFSGSAYKIMFCLGVADCLQLFFHSFAFLFTIMHSTVSPWTNKICGGILNGVFFTFISCTLLLAFNRFVVICLPMRTANFIDETFTNIFLFLVWVPSVAFFAIVMTPDCSVLYKLEEVSWDYTNETLCQVVNEADFYFSVSLLFCGAAFYIIIFGKLLLIRRKYSPNDKKFNGELKLLFQATIIGGYTIFSEVVWHFAGQLIVDKQFASFLGNILWIGESGLTPFVYLLVNNSVRNAFFEFVHLRNRTRSAPPSVAPDMNRRKSSVFVVRYGS